MTVAIVAVHGRLVIAGQKVFRGNLDVTGRGNKKNKTNLWLGK